MKYNVIKSFKFVNKVPNIYILFEFNYLIKKYLFNYKKQKTIKLDVC